MELNGKYKFTAWHIVNTVVEDGFHEFSEKLKGFMA